ncbi:ubiquitin carboxyl-terminal hydrolase 10 isoform X2 [Pseudonaja textilis]|uniref:ubiquitin carboxyl-terminal hydrolase 10 isoform X2 n=1 Tax=Pseudonaja textilis TaxID=8673 RepID=UPI000EAA2247|nr:ubiquitin carboxyl-terminal hydrolase 10 isoform X2 [Pseudonaja textilis]
MAVHGAQYIFGEFSPDEFNQFFVTSRCSVELPPYNDTISCGLKSTGELHDGKKPFLLHHCFPNPFEVQCIAGEEYQRIEFGVNEVIEAGSSVLNNSDYSISSTLNPQAPEFILGCAPTPKTPSDVLGETNHNSIDCQFSDASLALDNGSNAESDSFSGSLGQRERKKKKKRPPGYYSYLEDVSDGVPAEALINGHASSPRLNSISIDDVDFAGDVPRTCNSPDNSVDFSSEAVSEDLVSSALDTTRTAGQPEVCSVTNLEQSCVSSDQERDSPLRTAVVQPCAETTENLGVTNGQTLECSSEGTTTNGVDLQTAENTDSDQAKLEEASPSTEAVTPVPGSMVVNQPAKSWASLFHNSKPSVSTPMAYVETKYVPPAVSPVVPEKQVDVKEGPVPVSEDPVAIKIAELLENVKLIHKPVSLQPRGLINKGNWCYINATLQALVACPPMYHLMKSIPMFSKTQRPCTSTPMIDSFVRLMNEFTNMPVPPKAKQALSDKIARDIRPGAAFEPTYIYRLLTVIKSSLSEKVRIPHGRQEDAEEYLGFILNGLHEEMLILKKLLSPHSEISNGPETQLVNEEDEQEDQGEGSEDEWEQVGPRNKSSVTRQADFVQTPITDIFGGHIRSVVYQQSSKESATLQPFFTLQLDIQSDRIRTVQDALESLVARESVQGYTTKTKQEVEISRRVTLEELPPVLVLHLKRFVYEKTGGCQKLIKNIEYPVDLEISKELLSPGVKSKIFKGQRTYRLFAVVYHHGNSATGGHYTTDVFQIGLNGWLRIDDQAVKVITQHQVVKPSAERTAYLLYYRRVDLL